MKSFIAAMVILLLAGGMLSAQQATRRPDVISYQGMVTSSDGSPFADGEYPVTVTLYSDEGGNLQVWQDTYTTEVRGGVFSIYLGSGTIALPAPSQMDKALWIGTRIAGGEELRPLTRLSSSPYAINVPDNAITTSKLADGAVTADKVNLDYISGVSVNGRKIDVKGTMLNIQAGKDIDVSYDEATQSLVIGTAVVRDGRENVDSKDNGRELLGGPFDSWAMEGDGVNQFGGYVAPDANDWIGTRSPSNLSFTVKVNSQRAVTYQPNGTLTPSIIGGYFANAAALAGDGNIIAGGGTAGAPNTITGAYNVISGGLGNSFMNAGSVGAVIAGGQLNVMGSGTALAHYSTIGGGFNNRITGNLATTVGGRDNFVSAEYGSVGGGIGNIISGRIGTIAGGDGNEVHTIDAAIGGGYHNKATGNSSYGTIAGGFINLINGQYDVIGGGGNHSILHANSNYGTIGGGENNEIGTITAAATHGTIGGGQKNRIAANLGVIDGGADNRILNTGSTFGVIGGGQNNEIGTAGGVSHSTIGGGQLNRITSGYTSTIGGGGSNTVSSFYGTIGGGSINQVLADASTVAGGHLNAISGRFSAIGGGVSNQVQTTLGTIGGGQGNVISPPGIAAAIPGGESLIAQSYGQTVVGVLNIPKGNISPGSVPNDEPIFIVGNGIQGSQSNAFEVSYDGQSTVFGPSSPLGQAVVGRTGTDNVIYAWGDYDGTSGTTISSFGVRNIAWLGQGWYQVEMNIIDANGNPVLLDRENSVTATIRSSIQPGIQWDGKCATITVSEVVNNIFDVYITDPNGCGPIDERFTFKVTGQP